MFAFRARERYSGVPITEAHPKALLRYLNLHDWDLIKSKFGLSGGEQPSEDERDAILGAVAARNGFSCWTRDLSKERGQSELDPKQLWFGEVTYFWPD